MIPSIASGPGSPTRVMATRESSGLLIGSKVFAVKIQETPLRSQ
jgi:hypothetical protein